MKRCPNCQEELEQESLDLEICIQCGESVDLDSLSESCSDCGEEIEDDDDPEDDRCDECQS